MESTRGQKKVGLLRTLAAGGILAVTLASTGCGSLLATSLEPRPYAGTRGEVELLSRIGTRSVVADGVLLVDMPLTVAMDTVLLPITIPEAIAKH